MLLSLNWLRDFLTLPTNLDPRELALRFTTTTAEIESVEHHQPNSSGLLAARIDAVERLPGEQKLQRVSLTAGRPYETLSSAPSLLPGQLLIFAPPGATLAGRPVGEKDAGGRPSQGMIPAGQSLGLTQIGANAIFLPPDTKPGDPINPALFDDWLIEIDNKSITHRPDCWGHYGIAREIAAMLGLPLKPYDITPPADLADKSLPAIPTEIDDPQKCPRYSALLMNGLRPQPSPLPMQIRLALCGMRPIDLIVDLTNYIMLELGQPMHAFDAARLRNIQVALAQPGEKFTTLDGVQRTLSPGALMIQCDRKNVALAGIMGGAQTEVGPTTQTVLLESANFDPPTIRRAATALGLRTEASARFEKSLDPAHTLLGIARFHKLAKAQLPNLALASTLSDAYPAPKKIAPIDLDCDFASRIIGRQVAPAEIAKLLAPLEFKCEPHPASSTQKTLLRITPPSFRATKDITIEADLIEEIARFIGYNNIEPRLPVVTARHLPESPDLQIEERTLDLLCTGGDFVEVHDYIWYDDDWLKTLAHDPGPCITLQNPAADHCSRFRRSLLPGMLALAQRNRRHFDRFQLLQIGSVFHPGRPTVEQSQHRSLALLLAQSGAKNDPAVWDRLRIALESWTRQVLSADLAYRPATSAAPWEDDSRLAELLIASVNTTTPSPIPAGRITLLPLSLKQRIDERLAAWSIALAEINLSSLTVLLGRHNKLPSIPTHPQVRLDFSLLCPAESRYADLAAKLAAFRHPLLNRLSFLESYQGGSIPPGKRSLTFRAEIGLPDRTLADTEIRDFQSAFTTSAAALGLEQRS